ncbi:MAG TPA: ATP synthase subunit C [bacterium]|nr:ATP synthase subunit C [bacterium]HPQ20114.1 ATP synthase subunit C [bacterium]
MKIKLILGIFIILIITSLALPAEDTQIIDNTKKDTIGLGLGLIGAAISISVSCIAAAFAVSSIGAASIGAMAEKEELFGKFLIFIGLAEGIAIYGLIVAVLIINKL